MVRVDVCVLDDSFFKARNAGAYSCTVGDVEVIGCWHGAHGDVIGVCLRLVEYVQAMESARVVGSSRRGDYLIDVGLVIEGGGVGKEVHTGPVVTGLGKCGSQWGIDPFPFPGGVEGRVGTKMLIHTIHLRDNLLVDVHSRVDIGFGAADNLGIGKLTECFGIEGIGGVARSDHSGVQHMHDDVDNDESEQGAHEECEG